MRHLDTTKAYAAFSRQLFPALFHGLQLQVLSCFPHATRRQAETIVALAPARRALVQHHRCNTTRLHPSSSHPLNLNPKPVP